MKLTAKCTGEKRETKKEEIKKEEWKQNRNSPVHEKRKNVKRRKIPKDVDERQNKK